MLPLFRTGLLFYIGLTYLPFPANSQTTDSLLVHFNYDKSALTPAADSLIDHYFAAGNRQLNIFRVSLAGYCDSIGTVRYNNRLSESRVNNVKEYLLGKWIQPAQIGSVTWFGKRFPLNGNITDSDRALNRRVWIFIQSANANSRPPSSANASPPRRAPPPDNRPLYDQITDTNSRIGSTIILTYVVFEEGRHFPLRFAYPYLDEVLKAMKDNTRLRIHISGYICCRPDDKDGPDPDSGKWDLSVQRAKFVYDYLVKGGISADRMTYAGYGASNKIWPEELDETQRVQNRRVEIRITAK